MKNKRKIKPKFQSPEVYSHQNNDYAFIFVKTKVSKVIVFSLITTVLVLTFLTYIIF
jgi:hypothetical protein